MRIFILAAFLALVASVFAGDTSTCRSSDRYGKGNFDLIQAINKFCGNTWDLVRIISLSYPLLLSHDPYRNQDQ
jgi:hypothetical protein